jgi:tRNA(adenine34) deaminase
MNQHEQYMRLAIEQAQLAKEKEEIPIGAILVKDNQVIATGNNQSISNNDPSAHAEIICLRAAGVILNNYRHTDCILYVTIEPCCMCVGAMINARIKKVIFGALAPKTGAIISNQQLLTQQYFNHTIEYTHGIFATECSTIIQDFFSNKRNKYNENL